MNTELFDLVTVLIALAALVVSVIAYRASDPAVTQRVRDIQNTREVMDAMERFYQRASDMQRAALDVTVSVLDRVAPLTSIKLDDALRDLLRDAQAPGTPEPPMTAEQIAARLDGHVSAPVASLDPNALG